MVTDQTTRLPMGLHQQLDAVAAVAIRTLPDLCLGIVSGRLGHLDPWIALASP